MKDYFDEIYGTYSKQIYRFLVYKLKNKDDAWDVFQEVFIKIYDKIKVLDGEKNIKSYIYSAAKNCAVDFIRKKARTDFKTGELHENIHFNDNGGYHLLLTLAQAAEKLNEKEREVFEMRHYYNYKLKEIAQKLQMNESTVKNYFYSALQKLKKEVAL